MALATQAFNSELQTPCSLKMKFGYVKLLSNTTLYTLLSMDRYTRSPAKHGTPVQYWPPVFCVFMHRFLPHPYWFIARTNISRPKAINLTAFDRKGQSSFDCLPLVLLNNALTLLIPCILILSHSLWHQRIHVWHTTYSLVLLLQVTLHMEIASYGGKIRTRSKINLNQNTFYIIPTDANNYKITGMLKTMKFR